MSDPGFLGPEVPRLLGEMQKLQASGHSMPINSQRVPGFYVCFCLKTPHFLCMAHCLTMSSSQQPVTHAQPTDFLREAPHSRLALPALASASALCWGRLQQHNCPKTKSTKMRKPSTNQTAEYSHAVRAETTRRVSLWSVSTSGD